ncbi:hypothetical protein KEM52_000651 [Ascosphaera acerosa]|nr:hypothetical protein KEM52_000651 [Ascosphaera acerosa]
MAQIEMSYLQSGSDPSRDGYLTGSLGSHLMSSAQRQSQQIGVSRTIEQTVERVGRPDEFAGEPYTHSLMLKPRIAVEESGVEAKPRDPSRW